MKPCGLACFQEAHHNGFPLTDLALLHWRRRWRLLPFDACLFDEVAVDGTVDDAQHRGDEVAVDGKEAP